ncbi:MAG: serine/threonine-protein phosphatase [Bacilli bacterium]|nr:serine/threonine-protein phosphatase [Bacilli bacterium]
MSKNDKNFEYVEDLLSLNDITKSVILKNEKRANKISSIVLMIIGLALSATIFFIISSVKDSSKVGTGIIMGSLIFLSLLIGGFGFFSKKFYPWLKWVLLFSVATILGVISFLFGEPGSMAIILALVLSCMYSSRRLTLFLAIIFGVAYFSSEVILIGCGKYYDINVIVFKPGVLIDLSERISRFYYNFEDVNLAETYKNYFLSFAITRYSLYAIFSFACYLISGLTNSNLVNHAEAMEKQRRLEEEKILAKDIVTNYLPIEFANITSKIKSIDAYGAIISSKETSADIYDFFNIDDNHVCFTLGDVSIKGMQAVLLMNNVKENIRNFASEGNSPKAILEKVNELVYSDNNNKDIFITMWLGILDLSTGKLIYADAGSNKPLISFNGEYQLIDDKATTIFVGAIKDAKFNENITYMKKGEKIFLSTASVIETIDINKKMYSLERLQEYLNTHFSNSVKENIDGLENEIQAFGDGVNQEDDITMLLIEYKE